MFVDNVDWYMYLPPRRVRVVALRLSVNPNGFVERTYRLAPLTCHAIGSWRSGVELRGGFRIYAYHTHILVKRPRWANGSNFSAIFSVPRKYH